MKLWDIKEYILEGKGGKDLVIRKQKQEPSFTADLPLSVPGVLGLDYAELFAETMIRHVQSYLEIIDYGIKVGVISDVVNLKDNPSDLPIYVKLAGNGQAVGLVDTEGNVISNDWKGNRKRLIFYSNIDVRRDVFQTIREIDDRGWKGRNQLFRALKLSYVNNLNIDFDRYERELREKGVIDLRNDWLIPSLEPDKWSTYEEHRVMAREVTETYKYSISISVGRPSLMIYEGIQH